MNDPEWHQRTRAEIRAASVIHSILAVSMFTMIVLLLLKNILMMTSLGNRFNPPRPRLLMRVIDYLFENVDEARQEAYIEADTPVQN